MGGAGGKATKGGQRWLATYSLNCRRSPGACSTAAEAIATKLWCIRRWELGRCCGGCTVERWQLAAWQHTATGGLLVHLRCLADKRVLQTAVEHQR